MSSATGRSACWELSTERTEPLKRVLPPRATNQTLVCQTQAPGLRATDLDTSAEVDRHCGCRDAFAHTPSLQAQPLPAPRPGRSSSEADLYIPSTEGGRGWGMLVAARCHTRAGGCTVRVEPVERKDELFYPFMALCACRLKPRKNLLTRRLQHLLLVLRRQGRRREPHLHLLRLHLHLFVAGRDTSPIRGRLNELAEVRSAPS